MKNTNFRIAVVEPSNSGGLIHFSYQLCNALAKSGADVTLIAGSDYELDKFPHYFEVQKILKLWNSFEDRSVIKEQGFIKRLALNLFKSVRRIKRAVQFAFAWVVLTRNLIRWKPDWVLLSVMRFPLEPMFIRYLKYRGIKVSQICHEFEEREEGFSILNRLLYHLNLYGYLSMDKIFFLSDDSKNRFLEIYPEINESAAVSIPHGNSDWLLSIQIPPSQVNLHQRYQITQGEPVVVFFGLLAPSKGIDDLIEAFAIVLKDRKAKLVIAGYPTKYVNATSLRMHIEKLGISPHVVLDLRYVPLDEIGALMDIASVVVYPYHSSTQSGSLQTAYTFGKPVIASAVGGLPEVVEDGKSGYLVPPQDPQKLAEKISILVDDTALAVKMGEYAKHLSATKFSWEVVAEKILQIFQV